MIAPLVILSVVMAAAWLFQRLVGNAGWADTFWSYAIGIAGVVAAATVASPRHWLIAGVIALWSLRLGSAIALRNAGAPEDARYATMHREWGGRYQIKMFGFLQLQALAAWPLIFAVRAAAGVTSPLGAHDAMALAIALVAIGGEAIADQQLRAFRRRFPHGAVCDAGLWYYSRHPNYFFEAFGWCALPCFAFPTVAATAIAFLAPATIYILLVYVSGIPPLEAHMLATHGERFREYQSRTSAFFPRLPRHRS
jgi:steroid 5-alpha reductase family enzyme